MRTFLLILGLAACGGLAGDGTVEEMQRRDFAYGAFVTWNREMPVEIEQILAGLDTERPVHALAGPEFQR